MSLIDKIKGWQSAENPAKINLTNIWNTIEGYVKGSKLYKRFLPTHIKEQIYFRALVSQECLENTFCKSCGCIVSKKIYINENCSRLYEGKTPCYTKFLSKEDWENLNIDKSIILEGQKILDYYEK